MADIMNIEVLADGALKITTDKVSAANHMNAEAFLRDASKMMGGIVDRIRKPHSHIHTHEHDHIHA